MRHVILGTAGHIDHGKSALVRALTGIDPDRLPEEKERGMTIDLGFAYLDLPVPGQPSATFRIGIVDVPGHERFIKNMVAGATGIDLALLVVAADDSVMPQTIEHVEVLDLLGIASGIVAINKCDIVDANRVKQVREDVLQLLQGTVLENAPILEVSAVTGAGLDGLKRTLADLAWRFRRRRYGDVFRMPIDRVFTVAGRGTVVTGSVMSGQLRLGEDVELLPQGVRIRVRGIQSHDQEQTEVEAGQRAALNLAGVKSEELARGDELAAPGFLEPSRIVDAHFRLLSSAIHPLKSGTEVRVGIATREVSARIVFLDRNELRPGESAFAQFQVDPVVMAQHGQPFVVRGVVAGGGTATGQTLMRVIGGGRILRPVAKLVRVRQFAKSVSVKDEFLTGLRALSSAEPIERLSAAIRDAGFAALSVTALSARCGMTTSEVADKLAELEREKAVVTVALPAGGNLLVHSDNVARVQQKFVEMLRQFHKTNPLKPGVDEATVGSKLAELVRAVTSHQVEQRVVQALLGRMMEAGILKRRGVFIALAEFQGEVSSPQEALKQKIVEEIQAAGLQPPVLEALKCAAGSKQDVIRALAKLAVAEGSLVEIATGLYLHREWLEQLKQRVRELLADKEAFSVPEFRDALGITRKHAIPFLEYLDKIRFTRRRGDERVRGELFA